MPVAKNYTLSGHFITPEMLLYSKVKWDKLTADEQQKILTLAREAQFEQRKLWDAYNQEALAKMKAGGVQFHEIDKAYFVKATEPVRAQYGEKPPGVDEGDCRRAVSAFASPDEQACVGSYHDPRRPDKPGAIRRQSTLYATAAAHWRSPAPSPRYPPARPATDRLCRAAW
ncbi:2,3-diketo-L-gulonate TRAP transporter substrate-binding periplasmic protein [Citrobacter koseri]|uniref:2,3-diketo-L-gulonate TRAP transporter substrate-binding periplasmic protein n=1 Tax=Citrobacter koseri TaxID=545 RepID=A0A2X2WGW7_CITKO|nr:2,3-diketo-L-gulonate TRAP transporter substrate-binding periplasmic protein [Citrobacter koseri]